MTAQDKMTQSGNHPTDSTPTHDVDLRVVLEQVDRIVFFGDGSDLNKTAHIYSIIADAPAPLRRHIFQHASLIVGWTESNEKLKLDDAVSHLDIDQVRHDVPLFILDIIEFTIEKNMPAPEFYQTIWDAISSSLFSTHAERVLAFHVALTCKEVPYFQISEGLQLPEAEYKERLRSLLPQVQRLRFLVSRQFEQYTERADHILRVVLETSDPIDRITLMASVIAEIVDVHGSD